jgi:hypothetical protein
MMNARGGSRDDWRASPEYKQASEHLQRAEWAEALEVWRTLLARYGDEPALQSLVAETQLRLDTEQLHKVRGRRLLFLNRRTLFAVVLLAVLAAMAWVAGALYQNVIIPSIAQTRAERQQANLAGQAGQALAAGDYGAALALYDKLAGLNPNHPALAEGLARAGEARALAEAYARAQEQLAAGQVADAQAALVGIQQMAPNYRDVGLLLSRIEQGQRLTALLRQAADARAAGDLEEAVLRLEEARGLTPRSDRGGVEADLFDAYLALAADIVDQSGGRVEELRRADEIYTRALALRPQAPQPTKERSWARQYMDGLEAFTAGRWDVSIAQLELLYNEQPAYLNGQAAQLLYNACMRSGDALLQAGETALAWERYYRASQLQGVDTTTARALAASLAVQMTPTPTPLPTATVTPVPTATGTAVPTATPRYMPLSRYKGKIVYWSTRSGSAELWIMDPDGHNAFRIWNQQLAKEEYDRLKEAERRSPDGQSFLYVTTPRNEKFPQIFILYPDGKSFQVTNWGGTQYDPVWSPKGHWVAFVSNEPGNDEIFLIGRDGEHPKRLTWNWWEWDKHPSWSPDGGRLVFWSNREVGYKQIWLMNDDGSGQVNLSNNEFEEWDPIWIK